jgi:hypothetical protein
VFEGYAFTPLPALGLVLMRPGTLLVLTRGAPLTVRFHSPFFDPG